MSLYYFMYLWGTGTLEILWGIVAKMLKWALQFIMKMLAGDSSRSSDLVNLKLEVKFSNYIFPP